MRAVADCIPELVFCLACGCRSRECSEKRHGTPGSRRLGLPDQCAIGRRNRRTGALFQQHERAVAGRAHENLAWTRTLEDRVQQKTRELKRAHEHALHTEKMASIGKMAAVLAHEINNPLSG